MFVHNALSAAKRYFQIGMDSQAMRVGTVAISCLVIAAALIRWGGELPGLYLYQSVPDWRSVPEMEEILKSESQDVRLAAGRRMVERIGVEQSLEVLERSPLPHTGEGHLVVHQVGFHAYRVYGPEAMLRCKDYFLYACYHGAIIEAATDQGLDTVAKMANVCKATAGRYFQCAHAVGHSLLAMWNYDLPEALADCDEIFEDEKEFPGALSSCHNGAFMENLFGVHDWGKDAEVKREWLSEDPYYPCTAFEEKYQKGCWLNQAARIYVLMNGDIAKTKEVCEQIGNPEYTLWCIDNLARQIHPMTAGDTAKVFTMCQEVGPYWYEKCVVVNAGSYYSVGDPQSAITICQGELSPPAKSDCYQQVLEQLIPDINLDKGEKTKLCWQMEKQFADMCIQQLGVSVQ